METYQIFFNHFLLAYRFIDKIKYILKFNKTKLFLPLNSQKNRLKNIQPFPITSRINVQIKKPTVSIRVLIKPAMIIIFKLLDSITYKLQHVKYL